MTISKKALNTLITTAVVATMATATLSTSAHAAKEKCYGVVKAGQNACGSADGKHSCQAQATVNGSGQEFIALPEGVCDKLVDGSTTPYENADAASAVEEKMMDKSMGKAMDKADDKMKDMMDK